MRGRFLFTALFLALLPAAASAQLSVGVGVGAAIPTGDFGDAVDTGLHFQGSLNIGLPLLPDLRVDGIYQRYSAGDDANVDILGGGVNVLLDMPLVVIKPYIIAGVGYYDVSFDSDLAEDDASNAEFGFTGGAGVRLGLGRLGVFAEARALRIGGDADLTTVPVLVGITF
ncbi:MAG: porin family protein [Candidatus Cloacimonetes bacterium]|jgi:opacity protein-like surface antigen|nr:porin family protein [Candidatus Cloacimonadota bacterium]